MTPEEYQQLKEAEKEHLRKLRELKKAVHVLERQKKVQSTLQEMRRSTEEALDAQEEMVERLALETAREQARLEIALDSAPDDEDDTSEEQLADELHRARARDLVERLKSSMDVQEHSTAPPPRSETPAGADDRAARATDRAERGPSGGEASANPTKGREDRPEKTIGRM